MSAAQMSMEAWIETLEKSAGELVTTTLGYQKCEVISHLTDVPKAKVGAYIPLLGESERTKLEIGILSDLKGCQELSRRLTGMENTEPISEDDVTDAIGEIANIIAGGVKRLAADRISSLQIGLPFFFDGSIRFKEPLAIAVSNSMWGTVNVFLIVLKRKESKTQ